RIQQVLDGFIRDRFHGGFELGSRRSISAIDNGDAIVRNQRANIAADVASGTVGAHELQQVNVFVELLRLDLNFVPVNIPLRQNRSWQESQSNQNTGKFTHDFLLKELGSRKYTLMGRTPQ